MAMGIKSRLLVFGYPLAEILVLWGVASIIGWGWALLGILAGIPIGLALMRNAGASATSLMQANAEGDPIRARRIASSMSGQFVAGALIAIPGYVTDVMGIAILIPGVRNALGRRVMRLLGGNSWLARMPGAGPIVQGTVIVEDLRYQTPGESDEDQPPAITR